MIVMLEGVDGVGKSTIREILRDFLNVNSVRGSSFESAKQDGWDLFRWYTQLITHPDNKDVIMDRSFYSNMVYASLFEGYTLLPLEQIRILEQIVKTLHKDILVVYLNAAPETIKERLSSKSDKYIKEADIDALMERYDKVMFYQCQLPWHYLDTNVNSPQVVAQKICKFIGRWS